MRSLQPLTRDGRVQDALVVAPFIALAILVGARVGTSVALDVGVLLGGGLGTFAAASTFDRGTGSVTTLSATLLVPWYFLVGIAELHFIRQSDSLAYYGAALSGPNTAQTATATVVGKEGFVALLRWVFRLGTPDMGTPIAVNAVFMAATAIVLAKTAYCLGGAKAAKWPPLIMAISVPFLVWGAQGLREAGVYLGISLVLLGATRWRSKVQGSRWICVVAGFLELVFFRGAIAIVLAAALVVASVIVGAKGWSKLLGWGLLVILLVMWFLVLPRIHYFSVLQNSYFEAERLTVTREQLSVNANSGFDTGLGSPAAVLTAFLRVLFGPFPWEWIQYPLAIPDVLFWWMVWPIVLRSRRLGPKVEVRQLLICALAILISVMLSATNFGLLLRVRAMGLVPLVPVLAAYLSTRAVTKGKARSAESPHREVSRSAANA